MLTSWESFFFASFDAGNFVSVDKPALGLSVQILSARLFGFHRHQPFSATGARRRGLRVRWVFHLVRQVAGGRPACRCAGSHHYADQRGHNSQQYDGQPARADIAAHCLDNDARRGTRSFAVAGSIRCACGLGYNIKMLQAFPVLPGFRACLPAVGATEPRPEDHTSGTRRRGPGRGVTDLVIAVDLIPRVRIGRSLAPAGVTQRSVWLLDTTAWGDSIRPECRCATTTDLRCHDRPYAVPVLRASDR